MAENVELAKSELSSVQRTAEGLFAVIAERAEAVAADEETIDIGSVRQIEEAARGLNTLCGVVREILAAVEARRAAAERAHRQTKELIHARLETSAGRQPPPEGPARPGAAGGPWNGSVIIRGCERAPANVAAPARLPAPAAPPRPVARVNVAPGIQLEACIIPAVGGETPEGVFAHVRTPQLHFYPPWGHFLLRVGSVVLHGGVGEIFDERRKSKRARRQVRTTQCRNAGCSRKLCPFYHDPAQFAGSQEVRNYAQGSWLYTTEVEPSDSRAVRRLGSASQLGADIRAMRPQDAVLLADQAMMSLLLALIACKYRAAPH